MVSALPFCRLCELLEGSMEEKKGVSIVEELIPFIYLRYH